MIVWCGNVICFNVYISTLSVFTLYGKTIFIDDRTVLFGKQLYMETQTCMDDYYGKILCKET